MKNNNLINGFLSENIRAKVSKLTDRLGSDPTSPAFGNLIVLSFNWLDLHKHPEKCRTLEWYREQIKNSSFPY